MELALIALILGAAAFLLGLCLLVEMTRGPQCTRTPKDD